MDYGYCVAEMWRGFHYSECGNRAGYGPSGKYCKIHAMKYRRARLTVYRIRLTDYGTAIAFEDGIQEEKAIELTESCVYLKGGRRENLNTMDHRIFTDRREAEEFFYNALGNAIEHAKERVKELSRIRDNH